MTIYRAFKHFPDNWKNGLKYGRKLKQNFQRSFLKQNILIIYDRLDLNPYSKPDTRKWESEGPSTAM